MPRPESPPVTLQRWESGRWNAAEDQVAAEEPLQLMLDGEPLSIVMRTPGSDVELALGLLWSERVINSLDDVVEVHISAEAAETELAVNLLSDLVESNQVEFRLRAGSGRRPERSFLASSACGVCGATTIESLALDLQPLPPGPHFDMEVLSRLGGALRAGQAVFERTGGLHAAGLFTATGELRTLREDIGRHNAVDKVVGRALLDGLLPAGGWLLAVSGRAGYEVVQKAAVAGVPLLAAVGAPSSLAVATAQRVGMTLVGFLREDRFNVYSVPERLTG
jgi:FdhD protein